MPCGPVHSPSSIPSGWPSGERPGHRDGGSTPGYTALPGSLPVSHKGNEQTDSLDDVPRLARLQHGAQEARLAGVERVVGLKRLTEGGREGGREGQWPPSVLVLAALWMGCIDDIRI